MKENSEALSQETCETEKTLDTQTPENAQETESKARRSEPRKADWLLAAILILAAYVYYSIWMPASWLYQTFIWPGRISSEALLAAFTLLFIAAGLFYARVHQRRLGKESILYLAMTIAAVVWFVVYRNGDQPIAAYMVLFLHGVAVYWLICLSGSRRTGRLDEWAPADLCRGLFLTPFGHFWSLMETAGNLLGSLSGSRRKNPRRFIQIAAGVGLSIPALLIIVPLLASADRQFSRAVFSFLDGLWEAVSFTTWLNLVMTLLIAMYLFGLFFGAFHDSASRTAQRPTWPCVIMGSFLVVIVAVYFLFFGVKIAGISSAIGQIAAGELLTSTYARDGFFELCAIAAINFVIFAAVKWHASGAPGFINVILTLLGAQTLAFICLAFSRMSLYISTYGLTFKRVFTSWFMAVLFLTFLLMMAELWRKFNGLRIAVIAAAVSFLLLAYSNMPAWMNAYNETYHPDSASVTQQELLLPEARGDCMSS